MGETDAARLLLEARRRAGLSQIELARRSGVPHSVISAIEHGRRDPGTRTLSKLLAAAGFRLDVSASGRARRPSPRRAGRILVEVLDLADRLPRRRRGPLRYPRLPAA